MNYRKLTDTEISSLEKQGCWSENWSTVLVKTNFSTDRITNVRFKGKVKLGLYKELLEIDKGILKQSGLYNSYIQDCNIDDNVYISSVNNLVGYDIETNVVIENLNTLAVSKENTFGNGTEIKILNEGGARELPIFDKLTSQIAYLIVNYRHDNLLIEKLRKMIERYVGTRKSGRGYIKRKVRIINSSVIRNVNIGECAQISGALLLEDGTIGSCKEDPAIIGEGVTAKKFIILSGSKIDGSSIINNCFIGQGVQIGKQYSAENSGFFSNSEAFHGEACSIFAGPYTVTHHKSTLLIAGLFSFYNAGSGTNQSNHMYKLGPVHQGILERGSKTGSNSYLMWPCRIGPFTVVIGKHNSNFDTKDFPFSYISEENGRSLLTPAFNLFTVGTCRDSTKWPARDRRKDPAKLDLINFEFFNPCIVGKIIRADKILRNMYEKTSKEKEYVSCNGIYILRFMLKKGSNYYNLAKKVYIGNEIVKRLEGISDTNSFETIKKRFKSESIDGCGEWIDISGMFAPKNTIENLLNTIRSGKIGTIDDLSDNLKKIHDNYIELAWAWCADLIKKELGVDFKEIEPQHIIKILNDWQVSAIKFNNIILKDAEKEFGTNSRISFGIDGDENIKIKDFEAVLGKYEENKFVNEIKKESKNIKEKADQIISVIKKLNNLL